MTNDIAAAILAALLCAPFVTYWLGRLHGLRIGVDIMRRHPTTSDQ